MYENNSCIYIGNIGKDPDMKSLKNGSDIVTTSLAVRQTKDKTMWLNLSAFGSIGASLMKAVKEIRSRSMERLGLGVTTIRTALRRFQLISTSKGLRLRRRKIQLRKREHQANQQIRSPINLLLTVYRSEVYCSA